MELGVVIGLLGIIGALLGTIAVLLPKSVRNTTAAQTVEMQDRQLGILRAEIKDTDVRHRGEVEELRREVAHVQGQMTVMRSDFAKEIAREVVAATNGR